VQKVSDPNAIREEETIKEEIKEKNNIDSRKLKFASTLEPFLNNYGREMLNKFYAHWTEPNKSNTKFRQELEKVWDLKKRLNTWDSNNFDKKKAEKKMVYVSPPPFQDR